MAETENITDAVETAAAENASEENKLKLDVDIQEVSACQRHIKVSIPREEVDRYFVREFDQLSENAIVPGFRAGKVPRKFIEKRFKTEAAERVKQALLLDSITQMEESKDIVPISEPDFDVKAVNLPEEGPFVYEYNIEVRPVFDVPNWKGLKIRKPVHDFTDKDTDKAIDRILENNGTLVDSDAPASEGDYIVTSLAFVNEGKEISKADNETIRVRPSLSFRDGVISDFGKLMTGAKPGDTIQAKAQLAETADPALSGKEIDAIFEIRFVKKVEAPTLEELMAESGISDVGDLRDLVQDALKRQLDHDQRKMAREDITNELLKSVNIELPPATLQRQANRELQRAIMEMRRSGLDDAKILPQINFLRQNSQKVTARALKEHFILERIADVEDIKAEEVDYDMEIALLAAQADVSTRKMRSRIEKNGEMDILQNQIIERKVINLILTEAQFTEVPWSEEEENAEAIDRAAAKDDDAEAIPEVSEEEVKEAARAAANEPKMKK